jgi:hypothetical protein
MPTTVLLLGRRGVVVDDVQRRLGISDVQLIGGTAIDDVRVAFARANVDHVIMGAGIDLETRLQIIREIYQLSDQTTVHLKDRVSGPEGFLPFIRAVLRGLRDYEAASSEGQIDLAAATMPEPQQTRASSKPSRKGAQPLAACYEVRALVRIPRTSKRIRRRSRSSSATPPAPTQSGKPSRVSTLSSSRLAAAPTQSRILQVASRGPLFPRFGTRGSAG